MFLKCISNAEFGKGLFNLFDTIDAKFVHLYRHFYASLIYADKYKTIFQDKEINRVGEPIPTNLIDAFKKQKGYDTPSTSLNAFRNTIYDSVKKSLDSVSLTQHLYTLNSPTGSGKTYNLINAGLILRDKLATTGIHARIVYGLPFTSIIDQVFDELEKICEEM
jgi:CRISPR-associated endonuclease/helicase Cas3